MNKEKLQLEIDRLYAEVDSTTDEELIRKNGKRIVELEGRIQKLNKQSKS